MILMRTYVYTGVGHTDSESAHVRLERGGLPSHTFFAFLIVLLKGFELGSLMSENHKSRALPTEPPRHPDFLLVLLESTQSVHVDLHYI